MLLTFRFKPGMKRLLTMLRRKLLYLVVMSLLILLFR